MAKFARDPYWLNARFDSTCSKCGRPIKKGQKIFYYPNGKQVLCTNPNPPSGATCGGQASAEFESAKADEAVYNGQNW